MEVNFTGQFKKYEYQVYGSDIIISKIWYEMKK